MSGAAYKKIFIWVGIAAFLAAMFGFFGYYAYRSSRRTVAFQDARKAFEVGNLPFAVRLAHVVLKGDPHHRQAIELLADIAGKEGQPDREKYWRRRAWKENPLDGELRRRYLRTLVKSRDFTTMDQELKGSTDPEWIEWRAFALFAVGRHGEAREVLSSAPAPGPGTIGSLLKALLTENPTVGKVRRAFDEEAKSEDSAVRLESALGIGSLGERLGDDAAAEEMYRVATNLNWTVAAPYYAQFLARRARFREATDVLEPYVKKFHRPDLAIAAGEFFAMQYRPGEIAEIAKYYPPRDITSLSVAGYFDALTAFASNDVVAAGAALKRSSGKIKTPYSVFMRIHYDILRGEVDVIYSDWLELVGYPDPFNLQHLAGSAVKAWVGEAFKRKMDPVKLVPICEALQANGRFDLELERVVMLGRFLNDTLVMSDLDDLLRRYPKDRALLMVKRLAEGKIKN